MNWAFTRPFAPSARTIRSIVVTIKGLVASPTDRGGKTPTESPEWTPARSTCSRRPDEHPLAVRDRVDVDLDALEIAVDPDRPIGVDDGRRRELPDESSGE